MLYSNNYLLLFASNDSVLYLWMLMRHSSCAFFNLCLESLAVIFLFLPLMPRFLSLSFVSPIISDGYNQACLSELLVLLCLRLRICPA